MESFAAFLIVLGCYYRIKYRLSALEARVKKLESQQEKPFDRPSVW